MKLIPLSAAALLILSLNACQSSTPADQETNTKSAEETKNPAVAIEVGATGYTPSSVSAKAGEPLRMVFTRITDKGCGTEIEFPEYKISKPLPLNEAVEVELVPQKTGTISFTCGMGMYKGSVVVSG